MPLQDKQPTAESGGPGPEGGLRAFGQNALDRLYAFRVIYLAIFVFILLYVFSVRGAEQLLQTHFSEIVRDAVRVTSLSA